VVMNLNISNLNELQEYRSALRAIVGQRIYSDDSIVKVRVSFYAANDMDCVCCRIRNKLSGERAIFNFIHLLAHWVVMECVSRWVTSASGRTSSTQLSMPFCTSGVTVEEKTVIGCR